MSLNANLINSGSNHNNTTSGDNSSDSASNKNTEKKLELVEKKLKICSEKIESLKKEAQREWSRQMNTHLDSFYETTNKSNKSDHDKSKSSKSQELESELNKQILALTKKLHAYEKRKQEYMYELAKENSRSLMTTEEAEFTLETTTSPNVNNPSEQTNTTGNNPTSSSSKSGSNPNLSLTNGANSNVTPVASSNLISVPSSVNMQSFTTSQTNSSSLKPSFVPAHRTQSFASPPVKLADDMLKPVGATTTTADDKIFFIVNQETNFPTNSIGELNNGETYSTSHEENIKSMVYGAHKKIDQIVQIQNENLNVILEQNEKLQAYLDDLQKKFDEQTKTIKEIQQALTANSSQLERIQPCLYLMDKLEKKLDEMKSTSSQSFQSLQYNFTHFQRDVKEIKEDVGFMKNKVEMVEKNQKNYTESNPTNYYQLFYKLLDIILTLATIFLLAITNLIASIKFIFLLYPRTIVILLFLYFLFFYLVDHNKLLLLFTDSSFLNHNSNFDPHQHTHTSQFVSSLDNEHTLKSNLTYFGKLFRSIYKLIFNLKQSSTTTS